MKTVQIHLNKLIKIIKYILTIVKNSLHMFGLILLWSIGALAVSWLIWVRFIRERLPKDIPIELSEIGFYIILWICCIYLYIVISLLWPRNPNKFIVKIVDILYTPLISLDTAIKSIKEVDILHRKLLDYLIPKLADLSLSEMKIIYIVMYIVPRAILVTVLGFDTFYFHKLHYIYKVLILGFIPLLHRYLKYSLKYAKDLFLKELDDKYSVIEIREKPNYTDTRWDFEDVGRDYPWQRHPDAIHHDTKVTAKEYMEIQYDMIGYETKYDTGFEYVPFLIPCAKEYEAYRKEKYGNENAELSSEDYENMDKEFHDKMPKLIDLHAFLEYYSYVTHIYEPIKWAKILIFTGYLICWTSILYRSYPTVEYYPITSRIIEYIPMSIRIIVITIMIIMIIIGIMYKILEKIQKYINKERREG
jgi:hypothetical protein